MEKSEATTAMIMSFVIAVVGALFIGSSSPKVMFNTNVDVAVGVSLIYIALLMVTAMMHRYMTDELKNCIKEGEMKNG